MVVSPNDPRIDQVGFAKLLGDGFELCAKKYEIVIGRHSKSSTVDVVLGDNMNISRQHAKILYNFSRGVWELHVLGKNGVTVEGTLHTPSSPPVVLRSQDLIQIADRSLYFLLPRQQQQWASPQKADPPAARSATLAASSLVPAQQHAALPPGAGSAHSVVQQLAASLPLSQQQAMVQRAHQLLQQQQQRSMTNQSQLTHQSHAFPGQTQQGSWVAQGQPHTGPPAHGTANQTHAPEQPYSASQAAQNLVPQDQAQTMETDGS